MTVRLTLCPWHARLHHAAAGTLRRRLCCSQRRSAAEWNVGHPSPDSWPCEGKWRAASAPVPDLPPWPPLAAGTPHLHYLTLGPAVPATSIHLMHLPLHWHFPTRSLTFYEDKDNKTVLRNQNEWSGNKDCVRLFAPTDHSLIFKFFLCEGEQADYQTKVSSHKQK